MTSPQFHNLQLEQRKCFFPKESQSHGLRVKSLKLCVMACRAKRAYELCNCVPIFYSSFGMCTIVNKHYKKYILCIVSITLNKKDHSVRGTMEY